MIFYQKHDVKLGKFRQRQNWQNKNSNNFIALIFTVFSEKCTILHDLLNNE